jgi:serine/threonine protein phosphatase 1
MTETGFIGDVHGCIDELDEIVSLARSRASHLVFLGDYVDRGRFSRQVIEYLTLLQQDEAVPTTFLAGNHDQSFLDALIADGLDRFLRIGGAATIKSYVGPPDADVGGQLRAAVPKSHLAFLKSLRIRYEAEDVFATHAAASRANLSVLGREQRFGIFGHYPQKAILPRLERNQAYIDTGCGTLPGGRLTCLFWPSRSWIQSKPWAPGY